MLLLKLKKKINALTDYGSDGLISIWAKNETPEVSDTKYCSEGDTIVVSININEEEADIIGYKFKNTEIKLKVNNGQLVIQ